MDEERLADGTSSEQYNKKLLNCLVGIAVTLVILMILLVLAALGFLLYGLIAGKLDVSIIGVVAWACIIGFGLLFGLFRIINRTVRRQAPGQEDEQAGWLQKKTDLSQQRQR